MALLAAYRLYKGESETLEAYLQDHVFNGVSGTTMEPDTADVEGFSRYINQYKQLLKVEQTAVEVI